MRRTLRTGGLRTGTLSLLLMSAALVCAGQASAQAIDCWLLDQDGLARAHERGLCEDAFARNTQAGKPAGGQTVVIPKRHDGEVAAMPPAKPPPAPAKPRRTATIHRTHEAPQPAVQPSEESPRELSSWAAPRGPEPQPPAVPRVAGAQVAGIDQAVVQPPLAQAPPPDPITAFANNFQRDFRSLMLKLNEVLSDPSR